MTSHDHATHIHQIYAMVGTGVFYFRDVDLHPGILNGLWQSGYLIRVSVRSHTTGQPATYQLNMNSGRVNRWIKSPNT